MTKSELREKIKNLAKQVYSKAKSSTPVKVVDLDTPTSVSLDVTRFPALEKFPTLKDTIIKLLTDQYDLFIKDIEWVAPRPTTFRIILANEQPFYLIYTDRTWIGKVEGKKYYLLNLSEEQNCIESIARILSYGAKAAPEKEVPVEAPTSSEPLAPEEPAPETPTPETPEEETPPIV
jgi:hypothetical protein